MPDQQPDLHAIELFQKRGYRSPNLTTLPDRPSLYQRFVTMAKEVDASDQLYVGDFPLLDTNGNVADPNFPMCTTAFAVMSGDKLLSSHTIVSPGMLSLFNDDQATAFLAHELGHAAHPVKNVIGANPTLSSWVEDSPLLVALGVGAITAAAATAGAFIKHAVQNRKRSKDSSLAQDKPEAARFTRRTALKIGAVTAATAAASYFGVKSATSDCTHERVEMLADQEAVRLCAHAFMEEAKLEGKNLGEEQAVARARAALISGMKKLEDYYRDLGLEPSKAHGSFTERVERIQRFNAR